MAVLSVMASCILSIHSVQPKELMTSNDTSLLGISKGFRVFQESKTKATQTLFGRVYYLFIYLVVLGFELRASRLLGRHSTT
jgi:hypothetical protein